MGLGYTSGGTPYLSGATSGHMCINMVKATSVVTCAQYYGSSQLDLGKEPAPPESSLWIEKPMDKPEVPPHIPKGVLNLLGHNPNTRATHNYSIVEDLG